MNAGWRRPSRLPSGILYRLRLCPLYLIPAVLLWNYIRSGSASPGQAHCAPRLFLLPDVPARLAVVGGVAIVLATLAPAAHGRSDASVREMIGFHREDIRAAASRYDVDPRLVGTIVHVTHRDQPAPFREDALERVVVSAWAVNMRRALRIGAPRPVETRRHPLPRIFEAGSLSGSGVRTSAGSPASTGPGRRQDRARRSVPAHPREAAGDFFIQIRDRSIPRRLDFD